MLFKKKTSTRSATDFLRENRSLKGFYSIGGCWCPPPPRTSAAEIKKHKGSWAPVKALWSVGPNYSQRPSSANSCVSQKSSTGAGLWLAWCFLWVLQCGGAGESVCQSISKLISLLRERGVCVVLRQQQWAQTRPRRSEKRPTPGDTRWNKT